MKINRPGAATQALKPGEYEALVVSCNEENSKASGKPMLVIQFEVESPKGRYVKIKSWSALHNSQRVEELYDSFPNAIDEDGFLESDRIEGEWALIDIIQEEWNDKMTDKVDSIALLVRDGSTDNNPAKVNLDECPF